jgi:S-adenosylmethionine synthetase
MKPCSCRGAHGPPSWTPQEIVERKGLGHPDTICDSIVEAISIDLNRMYLEQLGAIPHYNVDKALLIAGRCAKAFGSGRLTQPMELIVGDRATSAVGVTGCRWRRWPARRSCTGPSGTCRSVRA